jgi:hypothetical protein
MWRRRLLLQKREKFLPPRERIMYDPSEKRRSMIATVLVIASITWQSVLVHVHAKTRPMSLLPVL